MADDKIIPDVGKVDEPPSWETQGLLKLTHLCRNDYGRTEQVPSKRKIRQSFDFDGLWSIVDLKQTMEGLQTPLPQDIQHRNHAANQRKKLYRVHFDLDHH